MQILKREDPVSYLFHRKLDRLLKEYGTGTDDILVHIKSGALACDN